MRSKPLLIILVLFIFLILVGILVLGVQKRRRMAEQIPPSIDQTIPAPTRAVINEITDAFLKASIDESSKLQNETNDTSVVGSDSNAIDNLNKFYEGSGL